MLMSWADLNWQMRSQKQPTLVHKPRFTMGKVVGLKGVDVVEVFELVVVG